MKCVGHDGLHTWRVSTRYTETSLISFLKNDIYSFISDDSYLSELLDLRLLSIYSSMVTEADIFSHKFKITDRFSNIECIYRFKDDYIEFEYINKLSKDFYEIRYCVEDLPAMVYHLQSKVIPSIKSSLLLDKFTNCFVAAERLSKYYGNDYIDLSWLDPKVIYIRVLDDYFLEVNFTKEEFTITSFGDERQLCPSIKLNSLKLDSVSDWDNFLSIELEKLSVVI